MNFSSSYSTTSTLNHYLSQSSTYLHYPSIFDDTFKLYQLVIVDTSNKNICVSATLPNLSATLPQTNSCKNMFRKVYTLVLESNFSSSELVATMYSYFHFNTRSAGVDVTWKMDKICNAIFHIEHLTCLKFHDYLDKSVYFSTPDPCLPG